MDDSTFFIIGANGQLGTALQTKYPRAKKTDVSELDISNHDSVASYDWSGIKVILNAAAYTNVDGAETEEGRLAAWEVNAQAVGYLAEIAQKNDITLVHISTDYVFDGTKNPHTEDEPFSPLSVYGASKAAGDILLGLVSKHYLIRASWMIGEGQNFVRTMLELGAKGISPTVVADQVGRPTFTNTLVQAISHLLTTNCQYGTYNVSNGGESVSWADLARAIFEEANLANTVANTTTAEYYKDKPQAAPRPLNSTFNLSKIEATGFKPTDWRTDLREYIKKEAQS